MVPSAVDASNMLNPHTSPSSFFTDFVLFPFPCLPFWFSMGPLGSGRCTWGTFEGLCQELEWSLYKLAFNAAPVSPCAIIGKPVSSLLWSIALLSWLRPSRRGAYKDLLGGCDAPFQSGSWIRPPSPTSCHTRTPQRQKLHVISRQPGCSDREQDRHRSLTPQLSVVLLQN